MPYAFLPVNPLPALTSAPPPQASLTSEPFPRADGAVAAAAAVLKRRAQSNDTLVRGVLLRQARAHLQGCVTDQEIQAAPLPPVTNTPPSPPSEPRRPRTIPAAATKANIISNSNGCCDNAPTSVLGTLQCAFLAKSNPS
jgi:hypothetical protein